MKHPVILAWDEITRPPRQVSRLSITVVHDYISINSRTTRRQIVARGAR